MKNLIRGVVVVACLSATVSDARTTNGSGIAKSESRTVRPFTSIFVDAPIDVTVNVGLPQSVDVSIDDNILGSVVIDVSHGELRVTTTGEWNTRIGGKVNISVPMLIEAYTNSLSTLDIRNLSGKTFSLYTAGMGGIHLDGTVERLEIESDGFGIVDARRLFAESADVTARSSGDVFVWARQSLIASVFADGDIECFGNPRDLIEEREGSGDVTRR